MARRSRQPPGPASAPGGDAAWQAWLARWVAGEATLDVWVGAQLDAERLAARRDERIERIVAHALRASPFYRALWRDVVSPIESFTSLPVVTRAALMAHFDDVVTDPLVTRASLAPFLADPDAVGDVFAGRYAVWTSSGTTGEPGIFVHDPRALAVYDALEALRFRRLATLPAAAAELLAPARFALVGATGGHFAGAATFERLRRSYPWLAPRLALMSVLQPMPDLVACLNDFGPGLLATYPSAAALLADEQRAGRLRLSLRELWTGGENLTPEMRTHIREAFGCTVRDDYGASEFLPIAWECDLGALHLNADWVVLEPVDAQHRPVPDDTPSHTVLLTNLVNRVEPLVRYDLGDGITRHSRPCACGCALPVISVSGRADDVLTIPGAHGPVHLLPLALTTVIEDVAGVAHCQVVQTAPRRLVVRMARRVDDHATWTRLQHTLVEWLGRQGAVGVTVVREVRAPVADARSGKVRHVLHAPGPRAA
jgi:phenylacetate-coenzyme A ligase PaaK-like adenylate-forming protein